MKKTTNKEKIKGLEKGVKWLRIQNWLLLGIALLFILGNHFGSEVEKAQIELNHKIVDTLNTHTGALEIIHERIENSEHAINVLGMAMVGNETNGSIGINIEIAFPEEFPEECYIVDEGFPIEKEEAKLL